MFVLKRDKHAGVWKLHVVDVALYIHTCLLPSLKDILACQIVTSCRSARSSNVNSNHTFYLLALYQLMSTTAPALPVSSVSWKTALILEYRTGLNDRFMWAQEGRLWPVISVLKSPVGLHWPAGGIGWVKRFFWTSRRSPNEDPETPLERVGPGTPTAGFGREINYVVPQQLAGRKERDYTHKEINGEEELNNRGGCVVRNKGGEWLYFEAVVCRRESPENLDSPAEDECSWQRSVTACLLFLPFWQTERLPLTSLPVHWLVWDLKRLHGGNVGLPVL